MLFRRFRFRIRTILVAMAIVCIFLTFIVQPVWEEHRRQAILNEFVGRGAKLAFRSNIPAEKSISRSLLSLFGGNYSHQMLYGLDFTGVTLTDADLARLAGIRYIKELNLSGTKVTDDGLRRLQSLKYLSNLDLAGTSVTDAGTAELAKLGNLSMLRVTGTKVSYTALEKLDATLPYAHFCEDRAIEELQAVGVQVVAPMRHMEGDSTQGMWVVPAGREAVHVTVGMNRPLTLTAEDAGHLSYLRSLQKLTFHTITLGAGGLEQLQSLPKLKELEVWNVNLTDQDLAALARQTQLESLLLYRCGQITNDGVSHLAALTNLKKLSVQECDLTTREGMAAVEAKLSACHCEYSNYAESQRIRRQSANVEKKASE